MIESGNETTKTSFLESLSQNRESSTINSLIIILDGLEEELRERVDSIETAEHDKMQSSISEIRSVLNSLYQNLYHNENLNRSDLEHLWTQVYRVVLLLDLPIYKSDEYNKLKSAVREVYYNLALKLGRAFNGEKVVELQKLVVEFLEIYNKFERLINQLLDEGRVLNANFEQGLRDVFVVNNSDSTNIHACRAELIQLLLNSREGVILLDVGSSPTGEEGSVHILKNAASASNGYARLILNNTIPIDYSLRGGASPYILNGATLEAVVLRSCIEITTIAPRISDFILRPNTLIERAPEKYSKAKAVNEG